MRKKSKLNLRAFRKVERRGITGEALEAVVRQVMEHEGKPSKKSKNREPTRKELDKEWETSRR